MRRYTPSQSNMIRLIASCLICLAVLFLARFAPATSESATVVSSAARVEASDTPLSPAIYIPASEGDRAISPTSLAGDALAATASFDRPSVLRVYPLAPGATWIYSVTLDYGDGERQLHWTGHVTETVTAANQNREAVLFEMQTSGYPLHRQPSDTQTTYVAQGGDLYRFSGDGDLSLPDTLGSGVKPEHKILSWPLWTREQWSTSHTIAQSNDSDVWQVEGTGDISTPAGDFDACYHLSLRANPDRARAWFCPSIGIVRRQYHEDASRHDEMWELQNYSVPVASGY